LPAKIFKQIPQYSGKEYPELYHPRHSASDAGFLPPPSSPSTGPSGCDAQDCLFRYNFVTVCINPPYAIISAHGSGYATRPI